MTRRLENYCKWKIIIQLNVFHKHTETIWSSFVKGVCTGCVQAHPNTSLVFCILFFIFVFLRRVNCKINWTLLSPYVLAPLVRLVSRSEWFFSFLKNGRIKFLECTLLIKCAAHAYANKSVRVAVAELSLTGTATFSIGPCTLNSYFSSLSEGMSYVLFSQYQSSSGTLNAF
jgi:hypothetical protein